MSHSLTSGRRSRRGMSSITAIIVLAVTIVLLGAVSAVVFRTAPPTTCQPSNALPCKTGGGLHDVSVLAPYTHAQQGVPIPFTASLPEVSGQFQFNYGDGPTSAAQASPTGTHVYTAPGTFIVYVQALVGSTWHDNLGGLIIMQILPSYAKNALGNIPGVAGTIVSNTTSTTNPTAVLDVTSSSAVTVAGRYTSNSTDPAWATIAPNIVSTGGTVGTISTTRVSGFTQLQATVTFTAAGIYLIKFVAGASLSGATAYQNFTWTVYASSPGGAAVLPPVSVSPHKGKILVYELAPGGAFSEDPQVAYDTVSAEPIDNVYEQLVTPNGTAATNDPNSGFVPVIAACVPGSTTGANNCNSLFGSSLVSGYNWTFVISGSQNFFDPKTGNSWGVWPTDVLFTYARGLATGDNGESTPGWVQAQALLPYGNPAYDSNATLIHFPFNNTPKQIFNHIFVNSSACPPAALAAPYHGCVTFVANGSGLTPGAKYWPFFLQTLVGFGSGIVSAGWESASKQAAGIPGWTFNTLAASDSGDHPVLLPGGARSSSDAAFQTWLAGIPGYAWDNFEAVMSGFSSPFLWGNAQYTMAGSGPYYLSSYTVGSAYSLRASPGYVPNPGCGAAYLNGVQYCYPPAGSYAGEIDVTWETDPTPGEAGLASGVADFASIPVTQTALTLQLIQQGKAGLTVFPSISIFFWPFDFNFSVSAAASTYPTGPITVPGDFFTSLGMREFFVHAYPYATTSQTISTKDGIQYLFNYGGVIPQYMGNYYPTNISWPSGDPFVSYTDPNSPAYWWSQMTTPSSAYYNLEAVACTVANPCQLPFFGQTGAPDVDQRIAILAQNVFQYSNHTVVLHPLDINFIQLVINSLFTGPGGNPQPIYQLGWAPDYVDPTDYTIAMWYPNSTYTFSDAVWQQIHKFTSASCSTDPIYWQTHTVTQACQGAAYKAMISILDLANFDTNVTHRVLLFNLGEHIANQLALYIYWGQSNTAVIYAPWINGQSYDQQVTTGGGGDAIWFWINGNGVY